MRHCCLGLAVSASLSLPFATTAQAYDMDCAIILCMAGGFPSSSVCAAAYAEMIRRITPVPVQPPFGVCSFAAVPVELGGSGGQAALDTSLPDYAWLRRTRVYWFEGRSYRSKDDPPQWDWRVRSCDHENRNCQDLIEVHASLDPWPAIFVGQNGESLPYPDVGLRPQIFRRSVMVEYGDYDGVMGHSDWISY